MNTLMDFHERLERFLADESSAPAGRLAEYQSLNRDLAEFERRHCLSSDSIMTAKDIACVFHSDGECDRACLEMADFYPCLRHAARPNRCYAALWPKLYRFYRTAARLLEAEGRYGDAGTARDRAEAYTLPLEREERGDELLYVFETRLLEPGFDYFCLRMEEDGSFMAVRSDWRMVRIRDDGVRPMEEIDLPEPVAGFIRSGSAWYFITPYGERVYVTDPDFNVTGRHELERVPRLRVQLAEAPDGFYVFPFDRTYRVYDREWRFLRKVLLPQSMALSHPCRDARRVYARTRDTYQECSEIVQLTAQGVRRCLGDGLDFAPACVVEETFIAWPHRSGICIFSPNGMSPGPVRQLPGVSIQDPEDRENFLHLNDLFRTEDGLVLEGNLKSSLDQSEFRCVLIRVRFRRDGGL